jgi:hypothetical protein
MDATNFTTADQLAGYNSDGDELCTCEISNRYFGSRTGLVATPSVLTAMLASWRP